MSRSSTRPVVVTAIAAALTLASISATAGYLIGRYQGLPIVIPVEFRAGHPYQFVMKTPTIVFMPLWTQLILLLVIGGIAALLLTRAHRVDGADDHGDSDRMLHAAEAISLLGFVWITFQALEAVQLTELWRKYYGGMGPIYTGALLTAIVLSVVIATRAAVQIGRPPARHGDNDRVWRFTALYFNPSDPALFVPARYGYGLTLNFGRPIAIAIMVAILLTGLGGPFLLARALLR
jgi:uncharacterized membrane protein